MDVIFVVLPVALLVAGAALWVCVRSIQSGQFDDLETPAHRILHED